MDSELLHVDLSDAALVGGQEMLHLAAFEVLTVPGDDPHAIGINGHRVRTGDDEVWLPDLAGSAGTARDQGAGCVQDGQPGPNHRCQIRDPFVDVELGVETLPVPDQPHEPLQPEADPGGRMGLRDGDADQDRIIEEVPEDFHPLQHLSPGDLDLFEKFPVLNGQDMGARDAPAGLPDAGPFEAEFGPLQCMVQDQDLPRPGFAAGTGHRGNDKRVGRRGEVGGLGKGHVGFDDDALPFFHKSGDAPHRLQGPPRGSGGSPEITARSTSSAAPDKVGPPARPMATPAAVAFKNWRRDMPFCLAIILAVLPLESCLSRLPALRFRRALSCEKLQKITPFLWFDNQAEEAVNFYTSIFKNSKIKSVARYGDAGAEASGRPKGTVMTIAFQLDGQEFAALNGWGKMALVDTKVEVKY